MKLFAMLAVLVAVVCLTLVAVPGVRADNSQLVVTQDESAMEKVIESYLKGKHDMVLTEKFQGDNNDDLYLDIPFKAENGVPKFDFFVDTQPTNHDDAQKVIERGVLLSLETGVTVPADKRGDVLEQLNTWNRTKNFSSIYLNKNGEIVCDWCLNVMKEGLATEYVYVRRAPSPVATPVIHPPIPVSTV